MSPQSVPTTNLEVKNGVNCEHSPVDLSKVSRDMGSWLIGLRASLVEPRVQLLGKLCYFSTLSPKPELLLWKRRPICLCLLPSTPAWMELTHQFVLPGSTC